MPTDDKLVDLLIQWEEAHDRGQDVSLQELCRACPELIEPLRKRIQALHKIAWMKMPQIDETPQSLTQDSVPLRTLAGRYRLDKQIGEGGFGQVWKGFDLDLHRPVAVKISRRERLSRPEDAKAFLAEARILASLDHPNIVPVHDVGTTPEGSCYVVSKVIDGSDLATTIREMRLPHVQAAGLVATVAEALHYAHKQGLVHRDIKPANILLDKSGKPFVTDFGLALREKDMGKGPRFAGTPAYMSPEQARGEGHRVDGRSDIFSLGVVFYELLTSRRPFQADSQEELLEQVTSFEPRPPRQHDDGIPKELERICLKALSKRASERHTTAKDVADDIRHFLSEHTDNYDAGVKVRGNSARSGTAVTPPSSTSIASSSAASPLSALTTPSSDAKPLKIVPKGLRSFDAHDADFFLELLPGPRDREGLPDSIRFWKIRIEETDPERTFSVGLLCGPSGCGKSSLVKAGLLPRVSNDVMAVYVEATAEETETRLLNSLRKLCPALPTQQRLKDTLAALRRGQGIPAGKKVLIVLDQFEQWLHAKKEEENSELVLSLRQCDGGRVQCIIMVRDDFWMAIIRFMRELEIRLVDGQNSAAVDLFQIRHAEKVLAAFGRAFGVLPESPTVTSKQQKQFLGQAASGLAQEGQVNCVRLSLFAEMMKGRAWNPETLREVGGTEGIGATFLEETFSAAAAPPEHRYHQKAARAVLKLLLPEAGTDIKGHVRSQKELLEASGYSSRPEDFDDLIRILDSEVRLITPADPDGEEPTSEPTTVTKQKSYQLTHDYLIPSVRAWLGRKQKETRRGRAELALVDYAAVWKARPENRQLPSLSHWLNIWWLTQKNTWTPPQRAMMNKAARYHATRGLFAGVVLVGLLIVGLSLRSYVVDREQANHAAGLVQRVLDADITKVSGIIKDMDAFRAWTDPLLKVEHEKAANDSRQKLHTSLALLPTDPNQRVYLYRRLLDAAPLEIPILRDALAPHKAELLAKLWADTEKPENGDERQRFRTAFLLASYDAESIRWDEVRGPVVEQLVAENPVFLGIWMDGFRPIKGKLLDPLATIYRGVDRRESERSLAANILADYAADQPLRLADLLMDGDEKQFAVLFPKLKNHGNGGLRFLEAEIAKQSPFKLEFVFREDGEIKEREDKVEISKGVSLPAKQYAVSLKAGKTYQFTMRSKNLDSGLVLEDPTGKRVGIDDDGGGNIDDRLSPLDAFLVYTPLTDGKHKIHAASCKGTGPFVLSVFKVPSEYDKDALAKRQANAAVALVKMGQPENVWPLLKQSPDPSVRSYLIHRWAPWVRTLE